MTLTDQICALGALLGLLAAAGCGGSGRTGGPSSAAGTAATPGRGGAGGTAGVAGMGGGAGVAGSGAAGASGGGAAAGTTGAAGTMGAAGTTGTGGAIGAAGTGGATGAGGSGGASGCSFTINASLSTAIPTVGIVTFATDLPGITGAEIRFGLASTGPTMTAPVDLTQPGYRALLLGMKGSSTYVFRIVATSAARTCTSDDQTLATGAVPSLVPKVTTTIMLPAAHARGFIVTSSASGGGALYIFDAADGAPVWWATFDGNPTRAHMGWDGNDMYAVSENVGNGTGNVARISMDGANVENNLAGLGTAHHDLTAIPGGIATMIWNAPGTDAHNAIVERSADGTITTVVADLADLYAWNSYHPNAIHYYPWDDSYTLGDTNANLFLKITRRGALVWQFGGFNPKDPAKSFTGLPSWNGNHGHQLLADGTFLFFNNGAAPIARGFRLDTSTMTAASVLSYQANGAVSPVLGDVQRLPGGTILVTYSLGGTMHEIDASGRLIATFQVPSPTRFGYAEFRESLYGPPPY